MKTKTSFPLFTIFLLCLFSFSAHAQFPGFGGQQGGGQNRRGSSSTSSSGQYPDNQVGDAYFSIDPNTRQVVVVADPDTQRWVSNVIANLNRPQPQVLIKVVFVEVTRNNSLDLGVEGSFNKGSTFPSGLVTNFNVVSNSIVPSNIVPGLGSMFTGGNNFGLASGGNPAGLYQIMGEDYTVTLRALATAGNAKVLSRPSIVARNNQPATINVGQLVPLISAVRFDNFGNQINSVNYQSVGIILRVTPFITPEGLVELILSPETSELVQDRSQWVPISSGTSGTVSAPVIDQRSADTVVITPDGQTVVIGGLMATTKADSENKLPFLGDIPIIGNLFKHTIKTSANTELLIFLTPRVIAAPTEFALASDKEKSKFDAPKALSNQELDKFLDTLPAKDPNGDSHPKKKKK
jgi:type II secretory pathway component GspD/PulD (secretin)